MKPGNAVGIGNQGLGWRSGMSGISWIGWIFLLGMGWGNLGSEVWGQGVLVIDGDGGHWRLPRPHVPISRPEVPLLYSVEKLEIDARIRDSVARVQMSQTFVNEGARVVEARCVVPLPYDALVSDVTYLVDGMEIEGRLMRAEEARGIYQSYVRRSQDPALVQWAGAGMLQTSVFPIPPGQSRTVTIGYTQELRKVNGVLDWTVPMKAAGYSHQPVKKVVITAYLEEKQPIGNVYSPTHTVVTERPNPTVAKVRYESAMQSMMGDFRLMVNTSSSPFAATWVGYDAGSSEDKYFMLLLHPQIDMKSVPDPKDILLVLDKSGSMRGVKMEQAREALLYVLDHLPPQDRVGIVAYDSQVMTFRDDWVLASDKEAMGSARSFVQALSPSGGTNIDQALDTALRMVKDQSRKSYVVHLSDGRPTVGERDERQIAAHVSKGNAYRTRLFNFGVGHDVNSKLMDRLSRIGFGQTTFVGPEESIEGAVSGLYDRLSQPALSDMRWELVGGDGVRVKEVYPAKVYDMFAGDQATIVGRFAGRGTVNLMVTGMLGEKAVTMEQALDLNQVRGRGDGSFVASLWAGRRAAAIVDEIDLEGRKPELIAELVELAKKYGILTEYTAFLAEDPAARRSMETALQGAELRLGGLSDEVGQGAFRQRSGKASQSKADNLAANDAAQSMAARGAEAGGLSPSGGLSAGGGKQSFGAGGAGGRGGMASEGKLSGDRAKEGQVSPAVQLKRSGDRAFFLEEGKWVDSQLVGKDQSRKQKVERFSERYFVLLEKHLALLEPMLDSDYPIVVELDGEIWEL